MTIGILMRREWTLHGRLVLDFAAVASLLCILGDASGPRTALFLGALLAGLLGPRLAGDERLHGILEFVLTRPVERGRWMSTRFAFGLASVLGLWLFVAGADLYGLHERFGGLLVESAGDADRDPFHGEAHLCVGGCLAMMYSFAWWATVGETRPDSIRSQGWTAGLLTALVGAVFFVVAHLLVHTRSGPAYELEFSNPSGPTSTAIFVSLCLGAGAGAFMMARHRWRRVESTDTRDLSGNGGPWWILILLVIVLLAAGFVFLLGSRVVDHTPSPPPASAPGEGRSIDALAPTPPPPETRESER